MRKCLTESPVVGLPDPSLPYVLYCDSSDKAIGYSLANTYPDGTDRFCGYASRGLSKHEINYSITDKEMLALVEGLKFFHELIYGRHVTVKTDHAALLSLNKSVKSCSRGRLMRWGILLSDYTYTVQFVKGSSHIVPDFLSRIPNQTPEESKVLGPEFSDDFFIKSIGETAIVNADDKTTEPYRVEWQKAPVTETNGRAVQVHADQDTTAVKATTIDGATRNAAATETDGRAVNAINDTGATTDSTTDAPRKRTILFRPASHSWI